MRRDSEVISYTYEKSLTKDALEKHEQQHRASPSHKGRAMRPSGPLLQALLTAVALRSMSMASIITRLLSMLRSELQGHNALNFGVLDKTDCALYIDPGAPIYAATPRS